MKKQEEKLGIANSKRRYDLPLNNTGKNGGVDFLMLLIGLMTFLAVLTLAASFTLSAMTDRWSSGLENMITIEIPADISNRKSSTSYKADNIARALREQPSVVEVTILSNEQIKELVEPWLGGSMLILDLPLPGLISVKVKNTDAKTIKSLEKIIKDIAPKARLDTHKEWLESLLSFTKALHLAAVTLSLIIAATTIIAVAGAVKSRMAEHHAEIELLHLMGATDEYISRQLQRYSTLLALQGGSIGVILGAITLAIIGWVAGEMKISLLPDFRLNNIQILALVLVPAAAALISTVTARRTVMRALVQMS